MYLWNTNKLINDFKQENVTQKETLKYLLLLSLGLVLKNLCYELQMAVSVHDPTALSRKTVVTTHLVLALINIAGIYLCYRKNYQGDDKHFVERFICLTVPVQIKLFFWAMIFFIGQFSLKYILKERIYSFVFESGAYIFTFTIILEVIFYTYMVSCFNEISSGLASQNDGTVDVIW